MRRVNRAQLSVVAARYLQKKQLLIDGGREVTRTWKAARQTLRGAEVLRTLQRMMGTRARCMYCLDSHGADIEHFRPKVPYPASAFLWDNLLLCCTECGRFKGDRFPIDQSLPLLIDPTSEDPWVFLDFDPQTGNLTARFDRGAAAYIRKGMETVEMLQLDCREALADGHKKTWRRLVREVQLYLDGEATGAAFVQRLLNEDDHGLLGWCFHGTGIDESPFREWRQLDPVLWVACAERVRQL